MTGANKCLFSEGDQHCSKHRMYAFPGEKAQFCSTHKVPGMVDVHNKRCEAPGCQKHPTYGLLSGRARFCTKHKGPNMVDVHCRPCEFPGCSKHPHYAFEGDKARFCASHKEPGMVDVKHKRCHKPGCREMRVYETPEKKSRFCTLHLAQWLSSKTARRTERDPGSAPASGGGAKRQRASTPRGGKASGNGGGGNKRNLARATVAADSTAGTTAGAAVAEEAAQVTQHQPGIMPDLSAEEDGGAAPSAGLGKRKCKKAPAVRSASRARSMGTTGPGSAPASGAKSPPPGDICGGVDPAMDAFPKKGAVRKKPLTAASTRAAAAANGTDERKGGAQAGAVLAAAAASGSTGGVRESGGGGSDRQLLNDLLGQTNASLAPSEAAAFASRESIAPKEEIAMPYGSGANGTYDGDGANDGSRRNEGDPFQNGSVGAEEFMGRGGVGDQRMGGLISSTGLFSSFATPGPARIRGRGDQNHDGFHSSRRDADGGMPDGAGHRPSYERQGYGEEDTGGAPPLRFSSAADILSAPKGHRRLASFDPNTDWFPQYNFLVGNGLDGGGQGEGGRRGLLLQPLGAPEGQGFTLPFGSGSFGSFGSFGGGGLHHHRGLSSGSVDLNVLAPVLAELRSSGGGSMGGSQYCTLPFPQSGGSHPRNQPLHQFHQPPRPHSQDSFLHHHRDSDGHGNDDGDNTRSRQAHHQQDILRSAPQQLQQQQEQQQQRQRQHHQLSSGSSLPVVAEPGTPPHILSDDAASSTTNGLSPSKLTPQSATMITPSSSTPTTSTGGCGGGTAAGPSAAPARSSGFCVAAAGADGDAAMNGGTCGPRSLQLSHSARSIGSTERDDDTGGGRGDGKGREADEFSLAREFLQFYSPVASGSGGDEQHRHKRLPSLLELDERHSLSMDNFDRNVDIDNAEEHRSTSGGGAVGAASESGNGGESRGDYGTIWMPHPAHLPSGQRGMHGGMPPGISRPQPSLQPSLQPQW